MKLVPKNHKVKVCDYLYQEQSESVSPARVHLPSAAYSQQKVECSSLQHRPKTRLLYTNKEGSARKEKLQCNSNKTLTLKSTQRALPNAPVNTQGLSKTVRFQSQGLQLPEEVMNKEVVPEYSRSDLPLVDRRLNSSRCVMSIESESKSVS